MKTILLPLLLLLMSVSFFTIAQRKYIDVSGTAPDNINKPSWVKVFEDNFTNSSKLVLTDLEECDLLTADEKKVIQSEHNWLWKWEDAYGKVNLPFYRQLSDINIGNTGFLRLETTHYEYGLNIVS